MVRRLVTVVIVVQYAAYQLRLGNTRRHGWLRAGEWSRGEQSEGSDESSQRRVGCTARAKDNQAGCRISITHYHQQTLKQRCNNNNQLLHTGPLWRPCQRLTSGCVTGCRRTDLKEFDGSATVSVGCCAEWWVSSSTH